MQSPWVKIAVGVAIVVVAATIVGGWSAVSNHSVAIAELEVGYSHLKEGQTRIEGKQDKILDKIDEISRPAFCPNP